MDTAEIERQLSILAGFARIKHVITYSRRKTPARIPESAQSLGWTLFFAREDLGTPCQQRRSNDGIIMGAEAA